MLRQNSLQQWQNKPPVERLSDALLGNVLTFLDASSVVRVARCSKRWPEVANKDTLWQLLYQKQYPAVEDVSENAAPPEIRNIRKPKLRCPGCCAVGCQLCVFRFQTHKTWLRQKAEEEAKLEREAEEMYERLHPIAPEYPLLRRLLFVAVSLPLLVLLCSWRPSALLELIHENAVLSWGHEDRLWSPVVVLGAIVGGIHLIRRPLHKARLLPSSRVVRFSTYIEMTWELAVYGALGWWIVTSVLRAWPHAHGWLGLFCTPDSGPTADLRAIGRLTYWARASSFVASMPLYIAQPGRVEYHNRGRFLILSWLVCDMPYEWAVSAIFALLYPTALVAEFALSEQEAMAVAVRERLWAAGAVAHFLVTLCWLPANTACGGSWPGFIAQGLGAGWQSWFLMKEFMDRRIFCGARRARACLCRFFCVR